MSRNARRITLVAQLLFGLAVVPATRAIGQSNSPFSGRTIVAREVAAWFIADGKMAPDRGGLELTYEVRDSSIVRRAVRITESGEVSTDSTEYLFVTDLSSFVGVQEALRYRRLSEQERIGAPSIRAIGRPGLDAIEILQIGPDWIQSVKTVRDYITVARYSRSQ